MPVKLSTCPPTLPRNTAAAVSQGARCCSNSSEGTGLALLRLCWWPSPSSLVLCWLWCFLNPPSGSLRSLTLQRQFSAELGSWVTSRTDAVSKVVVKEAWDHAAGTGKQCRTVSCLGSPGSCRVGQWRESKARVVSCLGCLPLLSKGMLSNEWALRHTWIGLKIVLNSFLFQICQEARAFLEGPCTRWGKEWKLPRFHLFFNNSSSLRTGSWFPKEHVYLPLK